MERDLTCIILSCIYNGNLVAEIGIKYAKTVWDNLSVCCCAKPVFHFPGVKRFFSAFYALRRYRQCKCKGVSEHNYLIWKIAYILTLIMKAKLIRMFDFFLFIYSFKYYLLSIYILYGFSALYYSIYAVSSRE